MVITAIIPLARAELPLKIEGRIVHCRADKDDLFALGIQFNKLVSDSREALEHILNAILGTASNLDINSAIDGYGRESFSYASQAELKQD